MDVLRETLEKNKDSYIKRLEELVEIDTHTLGHGIDGGLEKEGQEYMIRLFENMGADQIIRDPIREEILEKCLELHSEGNLGHNNRDRYNVYGIFRGNGGKSLLFNSHIDTMATGNLSEWNTHPLKPAIADGKMYGLGTADMKAGLMASAMAVQLIHDAGIPLPGDVIITSVCDEEGGGNGSMVAAMNGIKADGVVDCEGTSDELILAHMGFVFFKVEIQGKATHSGLKSRGVSAIEKAIKIINELNELEHRWLLTYKHSLLPPPSLNVGTIEGGTAGSTVADQCTFQCCIHYLPVQMSYKQVTDEFTDTVNRAAQRDLWLRDHMPVITMYQAGGAFEMEADHPFVEAFKEAYFKTKVKQVKIVGSPAGCDSRIWRNIAGCPTIQFGPGNLEQCHAVNEYVSVEDYLEAILIYANLILTWSNKSRRVQK